MKETVIVTALVLLAAPAAMATFPSEGEDPSLWGRCTAQDAFEQGNESSNGTVGETPPFANLTEDECDNATAPWDGTPGDEHVPEDPGNDSGEDEDDNADGHPDENDNPGNDRP